MFKKEDKFTKVAPFNVTLEPVFAEWDDSERFDSLEESYVWAKSLNLEETIKADFEFIKSLGITHVGVTLR